MSRDILREYGPDTSQPQVASARSGGVTSGKPLPYSPPVGPKGINAPQSPGLHDDVPGTTNRPIEGHHHSGSPGIGGTNHGCCGTQGKY